jgi:hypothetical protein
VFYCVIYRPKSQQYQSKFCLDDIPSHELVKQVQLSENEIRWFRKVGKDIESNIIYD